VSSAAPDGRRVRALEAWLELICPGADDVPAAGACTTRLHAGQGPVIPATLSSTWSCAPQ